MGPVMEFFGVTISTVQSSFTAGSIHEEYYNSKISHDLKLNIGLKGLLILHGTLFI